MINKLWKGLKLILNLIITSFVFNYFILILILLINPHISASNEDFFALYINLLLIYGILWFVLTGILFFIIQFFSEKKYPIGIFNPPTITYFLSFTILIVSVILYFNYDYYYNFLSSAVKTKFIKILLINLGLIVTSIFFVTSKRIRKKWIQILFLAILSYNLLNSYASSIYGGDEYFETGEETFLRQETEARKIRVIIMDGLSLNFILSLSSEQKLLNFNHLIRNGVRGKITTFKPNVDLSLLNAALSGLKPSKFLWHSSYRFKISNLKHEFNIFPRYILFRNSDNLNITAFYKRQNVEALDHINKYYRVNHLKTLQLIDPLFTPIYTERSLHYNPRFVPLFSDILKKNDRKYEIIKKSFFFDDYLKNRIPELKDSDLHYFIIQMRGLGNISKYFYQYYHNRLFENIPESEIKKYGWVIERYYEYYDSIIGNLISTTGDNELLVIMSLFEYEPMPYWRRILVNLFGDRDLYVYKSLGSQGTIFLYEKNALKRDYPMKTISIFDIFPTLLYYSGFQLSKDLQGEVIREIFTEDFLLNNPIDISTSYR